MRESELLYDIAYKYTHSLGRSCLGLGPNPKDSELIDPVRCFMTYLEVAGPRDRKNMEVDLFTAYLKLRGLEQFTDLLVFGEFELRDMSTGRGFPPDKGDTVIQNIASIPTALAAMFFASQELVTELKPRAHDVFCYSKMAHEFQWRLIETTKSIELWQIPWPAFGIPKGADDLKEEDIKYFFRFVYHGSERKSRMDIEYNRWARHYSNPREIGRKLRSERDAVRYREMAEKVHEILMVFSMQNLTL